MSTFTLIPTATLTWEGAAYYNDGMTTTDDYELTMDVTASTSIVFAGQHLTYDQAQALYMDLVSATLAEVTQSARRAPAHPFAVSTVVEFAPWPNNDSASPMPGHLVGEVIEWLRFALGHRPYDGGPEWEY